MSAFQLPETHIAAIAKFAITAKRRAHFSTYWDGSTRDYDFEALCTLLAAECFRSVRSRYPSGPLPGPISANDGPVVVDGPMSTYADLTPVQVLKACASYAYQSCETNDWDQTEAHAVIEAIERTAIRALPGFDEAPTWEIDYTAAGQRAAEADARTAHAEAMETRAAYYNSQN